jgi:hypothetical protein
VTCSASFSRYVLAPAAVVADPLFGMQLDRRIGPIDAGAGDPLDGLSRIEAAVVHAVRYERQRQLRRTRDSKGV